MMFAVFVTHLLIRSSLAFCYWTVVDKNVKNVDLKHFDKLKKYENLIL